MNEDFTWIPYNSLDGHDDLVCFHRGEMVGWATKIKECRWAAVAANSLLKLIYETKEAAQITVESWHREHLLDRVNNGLRNSAI